MKLKIKFIVNPVAGRHNKGGFCRLVDDLIDREKYSFEIVFTEHPYHAKVLAKQAIDDDFDVIAAVGGDGTVNEIAGCLIGQAQTLAIVPYGSGNGLARCLHIPLNLKNNIIRAINHGQKTKIDTAVINDVPFISVAGIGFDALIADFFAHAPSRGFKAYAKKIIEEYNDFTPENYTLTLDDRTRLDCSPLFVAFANSNQFGYNAEISPKASITDGLLDVCVFKKPHIIEVPYATYQLMTKRIDRTNFIDIYKAKKIKIVRQREDFVNVDGEAVPMGRELLTEINPLSLNILLPVK